MISFPGLARQKQDQRGFTIIELMIVIVVLVILSVLVFTTYGGIQQKNRNLTRQTNIQLLHDQIERYFTSSQHYPSRADMNSSSWLAKNLKSLDPGLSIDPASSIRSEKLAASPSAKVYAYEPTQIDGVSSCESNDTTCAKYTLIATYEGNVNGQTLLTIKSTN